MNNDVVHSPAAIAAVGLVAGRGEFPLEFCRAARAAGVTQIAVVAMDGETWPEIADLADHVDWTYVGQLRKAIRCLQRQQVRNVVFAGQVKPSRLFKGLRPDLTALRLLCSLRERNADAIFSAIAAVFEQAGLHVLPSTTFMEAALPTAGLLNRIKPNAGVRRDIDFGLQVAREISRLNIGQTVVVKKGTILAIEGFEGTDKAIRRGGELGHGGVTVVKVAKPGHDVRFDVPCIGLRTVESLKAAGARALAVQAGMSIFLQRTAVLAACDIAGISVVGVEAV